MQLRTVVLLSLVAAAGCGSPYAQRQITNTTPQTTGEFEAFIANAQRLGCTGGKLPSGEPHVDCDNEPGQPRYIFNKDNQVICNVLKAYPEQCELTWSKLIGG